MEGEFAEASFAHAAPGTLSCVLPSGGREPPKAVTPPSSSALLAILSNRPWGCLYLYFYPYHCLTKSAQHSQTGLKGWGRRGWWTILVPKGKRATAGQDILQHPPCEGACRARQTHGFPSPWLSFLSIFCPLARAKLTGLSHRSRCASCRETLFTAREIINIWRGSLISCHLSLVMKLRRMRVSDAAGQHLPVPALRSLPRRRVLELGFALQEGQE